MPHGETLGAFDSRRAGFLVCRLRLHRRQRHSGSFVGQEFADHGWVGRDANRKARVAWRRLNYPGGDREVDRHQERLGGVEVVRLGGSIHHRGWTLTVDPAARLIWPILPFSPYRNAPETELRHAVGVLSVPVRVHPPPPGGLTWRRGEIAFVLEAQPR
jgi:hypothetical protein